MTRWLVRRVVQALLVVFVMTLIVFAAVNLIGNPLDILVPPGASAADIERAVKSLGLDQPLWYQYLVFIGGALRGEFGSSFIYNVPSLTLILQHMPATLELATSALLIALVIGIPLGIFAGLRPNSFLAQTLMVGSILGFSVPTFWAGLMLIMVFGVQLGWLPTSGRGDKLSVLGIEWSFLTLDGLRHLALPALNLALFQIALVMRLTAAGVRETLPLDFIRFARAKGLSPARIVGVHVLKYIMIPLITVVGMEFGTMIAFAVVTETVFSWPGMGKLIIDSINALDRPVIVAYLVMIVLLFTLINLVVDILYIVLDPRVRLERGR
jgi:peptide/nickel transport system permease protein